MFKKNKVSNANTKEHDKDYKEVAYAMLGIAH